MKKKVALHNLGCKVNAYEVEAMQQLLEQAGYEIVPFEPGADVYVINTCTVTNIADRKSRQMLHKAKKMNPDAVVVATGCYVQTDEGKLEKDEAVDLVLGNNQKKNIVEVLAEYEEAHQRQAHIIKINQTKEYEELEISRTAEHVRAYIKVQDGCNQFCTYCIIPYARGRVRSREKENILREVHKLAKAGYKEVVLTGIHLSSYGVDFPEDKRETLLSLIQAVNEVERIRRIRLGSLEPGIVTEEFAKELSSMPKVCPHFHLSLQSGCDTTLERMNRRYRSTEYKEKCEILRKYFKNPALTTDVIVGFPMETEEDFQASYDFVKEIHFYETHIFKYSRRHGTKAAAMQGQLTEAEKGVRSDKMLELHQIRATEYENSLLGQTLEVLLEEEVEIDGRIYYLGHSREYVKVAVPKTEKYGVNDIVAVKVENTLQPHILS
ncbi:tRNA (N(6)-L-threonylcarbamoyladenosine(37)-C(2))-methylthiotransferase MtaB [Blautia sp. HCP3S3_H10_1]|uniref:tRNA (N(6)-L-threonylcarbamoyladenosine(37)-C(2))- methylthiotransferase MtaB n=1 Tax=unclassified Blautia TaxID=2648079 RepID=UPI003F93204A|nr:tRNA (N(6)-L-threonylcarbamoyladenosine(37)-C(2))-methylthiotransferase MtaB [Clostridia bacterium]